MSVFIKKIACIICFAGVSGCSSFIIPGDAEGLKPLEQNIYQLKNEVINNGRVALEKNDVVKLIVQTSGDWVKIYAYRANEDILSSERFLVIYLFDDDFTDKTFHRELFDTKFNEILAPYTGNPARLPSAKGKLSSPDKNPAPGQKKDSKGIPPKGR